MYVGEYFHYNITVRNLERVPFEDKLNVTIFNPNREVLSTRVYKIKLKPNEMAVLFPNYTGPLYKEQRMHEIYSLDTSGAYKIEVSSKNSSVLFMHFYEFGRFTQYPMVYRKSFDVMPAWEKRLIAREEEDRKRLLQISAESKKIAVEMKEIAEESKKIAWNMMVIAIASLLVAALSYFRKR